MSEKPSSPNKGEKADTKEMKKEIPSKLVIMFKPVGNAPILKQKYYKINSSYQFQTLINFLKKQIKLKDTEPIFCYINNQFSPAPDELLLNLYNCFQVDNQLIVSYCPTQAWG